MFSSHMHQIKDTLRATVRIGYDGRVHKMFRGPKAEERFANEVRVLRHLEKRKCPFVPRLLEEDPQALKIITTSCGNRVEHLDEERTKELFAELEHYGVRHEDADMRNVTYRQSDGRFCLIDFEFSTILPGFEEPDDGSATQSSGSPPVVRADRPGEDFAETMKIPFFASNLTRENCTIWEKLENPPPKMSISSSRLATEWGARWPGNLRVVSP